MKRGLLNRTPSWIKILIAQFGAGNAVGAAVMFLASVALLLLTATLLPVREGWPITSFSLVFESWTIWRLHSFRFVGQILCACGSVKENLSQSRRAKRRFLIALKFLADRQRAYEALSRLTETESDLLKLAETIRVKEFPISAQLALLRGRCLREAGAEDAALPCFELADKLAPSDPTKLELAELYLSVGAAENCLQTVDRLTQVDPNGRSFFLRSAALLKLGREKEALLWANRATQLRPCDSYYQLQKGRILETLGQWKGALRQYNKSVRVHPRNPDAFYHRGVLRSKGGDLEGAVEDFHRCCYLQNTWTEAYLFALAAKRGTPFGALNLGYAPSMIAVDVPHFHLEVGQITEVKVVIRPNPGAKFFHVSVLEPFGFGLEVSPQVVDLEDLSAAANKPLTFRVWAKRSDAVNLSQPWVLNFVVASDTAWANQLVQFRVEDTSPGRIFLVLTDDHETGLNRTSMLNGVGFPIRAEETECDLAAKTYAAQALAEKYSLKWTHLLDAGTAVGLPKWAAGLSPLWSKAWRNIRACYRGGFLRGHDHQVHLHLSAVPESYFFCYSHTAPDTVVFNLQKKNAHFPGWQINSWANVVRRYGRPSDPNSRLGSLVHSAKMTESVVGEPSQPCQPILFRAGQWDLGKCTAEREKSVMALRESFFLADSSVSEGYDCTKRPFRFGNCLSRAAYFTFHNNPEKPARRLHDAGILEVVPILLPQGNHPVEPRADPKVVLAAYRTLVRNGRVKPGRHLILEIAHLFELAAPSTPKTQDKPPHDAGWAAMEHHFATLSRRCTALESVTATEAVFSWFDYYTPELVVRLEASTSDIDASCGRSPRYCFPLRFLGQGILRDRERLHCLTVPLPSLGERNIKHARILRRDETVFERSCPPMPALPVQLNLSVQNQADFTLELEVDTSSLGPITSRGDVDVSTLLSLG